jgi:hypothetical protein
VPSTPERQNERKTDRRNRRVCINGEAFVEIDGVSYRVERFLDEERDSKGYPTAGVFKNPDGSETTFPVRGSKLGKHTGAGKHGRCRRCWRRHLDGEKRKRAKAREAREQAAAKAAAKARRPRPRRARSAPESQGVFAWAA